jgi:hypothetical protein
MMPLLLDATAPSRIRNSSWLEARSMNSLI